MANDEVLLQVISEVGYDGATILGQANDSKYKAELRTRTQEAKEIGICGVPSYRLSRRKEGGAWTQHGDIVWGQDLITDVEDYIAGWPAQASSKL